ncbi:penicillin-binding protein 2 [Candidatus Falkowbacteria bacterium]|jgi:cell division protein FtsI/penicillin-binding protein 2|nr:penicillin-binding protein 2 [Candidatus Falkowbacteria bacterium]MBT7007404.1 penicillin-binding protein 2 [Candidatus Falkowbacteria bacterium]
MSILVKKTKRIKYRGSSYIGNQQQSRDYRVNILFGVFIIAALLIAARLVKLQIADHDYYTAIASGQHEIFKQLYPERGTVYVVDKAGSLLNTEDEYYPIAMNKKMNLLYTVPTEIEDPEAVIEVLKEVFQLQTREDLNIEPDWAIEDPELEEKLNEDEETLNKWKMQITKENDPYEPLKHYVSDKEMDMIDGYGLDGLYSVKEITRYYPESSTGSQMIGFVGKHQESTILKGSYGLEGCYDKILAGEAGFLRSETDVRGRLIASASRDFREAEDGNDLYLTVDKTIQYYVCNELRKGVEQYGASNGSVIIMEPQTGRILAMCNYPEFDPNKYNEVEDIGVFNNEILMDSYESGSVFKPFTLAIAIDSGEVDPFTGYNDTGEVTISRHTIRNSDLKAHGWQTMTQVLEKSLNTGTVFAAQQVGLERFRKYINDFGFGSITDIDMCIEAAGNISALNDSNPIYLATASFGQGITTTPLQLARGYSAIANEGKLIKPYIVEKIVSKNGELIQQTEPQVVSQVISPQTAKLVSSMLVSVVKNGHATGAQVDGYLVAGKTGTAQVPDLERGGYTSDTIHTFGGFAPFNEPKFVAIVKLDRVQNVRYAADSAANVFGKISKFILDYYQIPKEN